MALLVLASFVSNAHARALVSSGLLNREVTDPLLEERLVRIRAQIVAGIALNEMLTEMGFDVSRSIDLHFLVGVAVAHDILNKRQAGVLREINLLANEAKHELAFMSRL